jgi:hypothetical protein
MIVSPRSSHSFGVPVIWDNVAVLSKFLVADCAFPVLFCDLPIEQLAHLGCRPQFPISPGVVWILDALNPKP